jgi:hypothetical protein
MKKIVIALIVLILVLGIFFLFNPFKKTEKRPPAVPTGTQTAVSPVPTDNYDQLTDEEKIGFKKYEMALKRTKVYAGDMDITPPCPEDTHEADGFCRKGAVPGLTDFPYIGGKSVNLDVSCRPDQCNAQCKKACEDTAGEECTLIRDINKECLLNFPPEKEAMNEAELHEQGSQCRERYGSYFQHYRCRYSTSEDEQFRYTRTATDEECRKMHEEYMKCIAELPERKLITGKIYPGFKDENERRCIKLKSDEFLQARCEVAWTEKDGRAYGRSAANKIICNFACP